MNSELIDGLTCNSGQVQSFEKNVSGNGISSTRKTSGELEVDKQAMQTTRCTQKRKRNSVTETRETANHEASKKNANPTRFRSTISGEKLLALRANLEMFAQDILECKLFNLLLSWVLDQLPRKHKQELVYPDEPKKYDSKLWSYLCVMPGIGVSESTSIEVNTD